MDVSIIIPTMNRPRLLLRLIRYYDGLRYSGKILIGDSSNPEIFQEVATALRKFSGRLDIAHHHLPGKSVAAAVMEMNGHVKTSYVCLVADDDFVVPSTTKRCIEFLDAHPDYVAAHGAGVLINSVAGNADTIADAGPYPQTVSEQSTASARLSQHLEAYSVTLFSVHRIEVWRKMFANTPLPSTAPQACDKTFTDELLQCCLSVVYGKVKEVDGLYLIRQVHDERYLLPTWFTWLNSERWYPSYAYFRTQLAQAMAVQDGISPENATNVVDTAFAAYLSWLVANATVRRNRLREVARRLALLRWMWRRLKRARARRRPATHVSLPVLLDEASPYHEDFLPVYTAVTNRIEPEQTAGEPALA
jgi:glycosyltransferase domain-containing protein